jgi:bacteriorhodopsin
MNRIASTSRIITIGAPIFTLVQRLNWVASLGWAVVTAGLLIRPKDWMRVVGLVAGTIELVVGVPLAFVTAQQLGRFSLFALGPLACLILIVLLIWPNRWERWTAQLDESDSGLAVPRGGQVTPSVGKP